MLKWGRICEKFLKRKLEHLVAGKILRRTEIKFEVTKQIKANLFYC